MPQIIEIKLHDGEIIRTTEDPKALAERFDTARKDGTLIEVALGDDETVWISPDAVVSIGKAVGKGAHFA